MDVICVGMIVVVRGDGVGIFCGVFADPAVGVALSGVIGTGDFP